MQHSRMLVLALCAALALFAAGCSSKKSKKGGGGSTLPTIGTILWDVRGGTASGTGNDGGTGGGVEIEAGVDLRLDNGTRPSLDAADNAFAAALAMDSTVTWAEVEALPGYVLSGSGDEAVVTLPAGQGVLLPAGATLDLSGAPTTVEFLAILAADRPIILRGTVLLGRSTTRGMEVEFTSSDNSGVALEFTGVVNGDGGAGQHAGGMYLYTDNGGDMVFLGSGSLRGGSGASAGNGGRVGAYSDGDMLSRVFSVQADGGNGTAQGGNGGSLSIGVRGEFTFPVAHGLLASGGSGGTTYGGNAGGIELIGRSDNEVVLFSRLIANGGNSTGDSGGSGGTFSVLVVDSMTGNLTGTVRGVIYTTVEGAESVDSNGGGGGFVNVRATTLTTLRVLSEADGGYSHNLDGGNGGNANFLSTTADLVRIDLFARGSDAGNLGGAGGGFNFNDDPDTTATVNWTNIVINAHCQAGNGGVVGDGPAAGNGGWANIGTTNYVGPPYSPINASNFRVSLNGRGGNGSNGGNGGYIQLWSLSGGTMNIDLIDCNLSGGHANGDTAANMSGGSGGTLGIYADEGTINVNIGSLLVHGGHSAGSFNAGGAGGIFANLNYIGDSVAGNVSITGTLQGHGGNAPAAGTGTGGNAAGVTITSAVATTGGNVTLNLTLGANGGSSVGSDAGIGPGVLVQTSGTISFTGSFTSTGGDGATDGNGGNFTLISESSAITVNGSISTYGGGTSGNGGSITIGGDTASTVTFSANSALRANGAVTAGSAGLISLDPVGSGPGNTNLDLPGSVLLQTLDGDGTDQAMSNIYID